jgi:hypothetical protein
VVLVVGGMSLKDGRMVERAELMCSFPSNSLKSSNQAASALVAELALQPALQLLSPKIFDASRKSLQIGLASRPSHYGGALPLLRHSLRRPQRHKGESHLSVASHQSLTAQSLIT